MAGLSRSQLHFLSIHSGFVTGLLNSDGISVQAMSKTYKNGTELESKLGSGVELLPTVCAI